MRLRYCGIFFLFITAIVRVHTLVHHLAIHNDDRTVFKIETFGFVTGGKMDIKISDFSLHFSTKELDDYKQVEVTAPVNQSSEITKITPISKVPKANATHTTLTDLSSPAQQPTIIDKPNTVDQPVVVHGDSSTPAALPSVSAAVPTLTALRRRLQATVNLKQTGLATPKPTNHTSSVKLSAVKHLVGFVMRHATSESAAQADLEKIIEKRQCILEHLEDKDVFIDLSNSDDWHKNIELRHEVTADNIGLYSLVYARCYPTGRHYTSFKLDATFYNPGPNYLSAGDTPLPSMYLVFFFLFSAALATWIWVLRRDKDVYGPVHSIHNMMTILLVLKCLSLFFESVRYHYISIYGVSEMWSMVYYVFAFLKGVMLFTVILLIGSGWSLMKSYLNDQEKRIVWVVLVLQVLDNIAMIVLEESAPGSQGWLTWRDILHLVDIICCCAILLPIVWSIRHLRMAAEVDGKARGSLEKLQLFRQFYVMVVVYVYFTRIVVYVLAATVPFYLLWLGPLSTEIATFLFFTVTGYKFRPALDNPYLPVRSEDSEGLEYGLGDDDELGVQLQPAQAQKKKNTAK